MPFEKIKDIPPYQEKTYQAVYKALQKMENFDFDTYQEIMTKFFKLQKRKRNKKRHIFSLPSLEKDGNFRIKRGDQIAIVSNDKIATKTFLVDSKLLQVPFFSKNVIPLKIEDLLNAIKLNENAKAIYQVDINVDHIKEYINKLVYTLTEASRLTVKATLFKSAFDIDFDQIEQFNGAQDDEFRSFLQKYIQNKESILYPYLGSIRDTLNGKAVLLDNSQHTITLQYKADINSYKKEIILNNI